jgi:transposase
MSSTPITRKPYPSDVSDEEWSFVAPYLMLLPTDASQRKYDLREVFNGVRYIVRTGAHWRMMPHDAARSAALATRVSADAPLDGGRLV